MVILMYLAPIIMSSGKNGWLLLMKKQIIPSQLSSPTGHATIYLESSNDELENQNQNSL